MTLIENKLNKNRLGNSGLSFYTQGHIPAQLCVKIVLLELN